MILQLLVLVAQPRQKLFSTRVSHFQTRILPRLTFSSLDDIWGTHGQSAREEGAPQAGRRVLSRRCEVEDEREVFSHASLGRRSYTSTLTGSKPPKVLPKRIPFSSALRVPFDELSTDHRMPVLDADKIASSDDEGHSAGSTPTATKGTSALAAKGKTKGE
jgi:hypothetical protein